MRCHGQVSGFPDISYDLPLDVIYFPVGLFAGGTGEFMIAVSIEINRDGKIRWKRHSKRPIGNWKLH